MDSLERHELLLLDLEYPNCCNDLNVSILLPLPEDCVWKIYAVPPNKTIPVSNQVLIINLKTGYEMANAFDDKSSVSKLMCMAYVRMKRYLGVEP